MKTVEEIRRENLKALSEKYGSTQALAEAVFLLSFKKISINLTNNLAKCLTIN